MNPILTIFDRSLFLCYPDAILLSELLYVTVAFSKFLTSRNILIPDVFTPALCHQLHKLRRILMHETCLLKRDGLQGMWKKSKDGCHNGDCYINCSYYTLFKRPLLLHKLLYCYFQLFWGITMISGTGKQTSQECKCFIYWLLKLIHFASDTSFRLIYFDSKIASSSLFFHSVEASSRLQNTQKRQSFIFTEQWNN